MVVIFNKFTVFMVALNFIFAGEASAIRHGRHAVKQTCQKSEGDSSHIARRTPRARHNWKNFNRNDKTHGRRHLRRNPSQDAISFKRQACTKKWATRKHNRRASRAHRNIFIPNQNAQLPHSRTSGRKHLKRNFSHRRNDFSRARIQRFQREPNTQI